MIEGTDIEDLTPSPTRLAAPVCSAGLQIIRLVIQLDDTPHNRAALDVLFSVAEATAVQGAHAVLKRENVQITRALTTPHRPLNESAHQRKGK